MTRNNPTKKDFENQLRELQTLAEKDPSIRSTMKLLEDVENLVEIGEGDGKAPFQLPYSSPPLVSENKSWKITD